MSTNRKDFRAVIDTFKKYYMKIFKVESFIMSMNDNRAKTITNFIHTFKEMNKTPMLQPTALSRYMEWQFNYWYRQKSFSKDKTIQIEWIIGNTAIKRWEKANKRAVDFVIRKTLKKEVDLTDGNLINKKNLNYIFIETNLKEESDKAKFLNTEIGLENCILLTNLYNHKSRVCMMCKYNKECKKLLSEMYPKIYKIRGYSDDE